MRRLTRGLLAAAILAAVHPAAAAPRVLRIGYQKYGTLVLEKARGTLEHVLAPLGVTVTWTEFMAGPPLLEAMGAGSIDFGIAGDTPPIFAQAAGVPVVYVAVEPPAPHNEGIIVPAASSIRTVTDLRGKRVAVNKGANAHNLVVQVLAAHGLAITDIDPVYLKPSDARAAFENGSVDAWAIWDPYLADAEVSLQTRRIADGAEPSGKLVDENREFFLANRDYARTNPDIIRATLADLRRTEHYAATHRDEATGILAPEMRMNPAAVKRAVDKLPFDLLPVDAKTLASQQAIADTFARLHLIPAPIDVREAAPPPNLF